MNLDNNFDSKSPVSKDMIIKEKTTIFSLIMKPLIGLLSNFNVKKKILISFLTITLLLISASLMVLLNTLSMDKQFDFVVLHDAPVIANAQKLQKLVVDMETGQRGFLITGKEEFLSPYVAGVELFSKLIKEEVVLVSDNPAQQELLRSIEKDVALWQEKAAIPEIGLARVVKKSMAANREVEKLIVKGIGQEIFDDMRKVSNQLSIYFEASRNKNGTISVLKLMKSMVDRETGQRGFLISGKEAFLAPYIDGEKKFNSEIRELLIITRTNKRNRELVSDLIQLAKEWERDAAIPQIKAKREEIKNPKTQRDISETLQKGEGKQILGGIRKKFEVFITEENRLTKKRYISASTSSEITIVITLLIIVLSPFVALLIGIVLSNNISKPLTLLKDAANKIAEGKLNHGINIDSKDEIGALSRQMDLMRVNILKSNKSAEDKNWLLNGTRIVTDEVKGERSLSEITTSLIEVITPYLGGQIGAFYIKSGNNNISLDSGTMNLEASYAYDFRNQNNNTIKLGEGLIGQAVKEKKSIIIQDIPKDYFNISSGIGKIIPNNVIVIPILFEGTVNGVIEIGTVHELTDLHIEFTKNISETIGIAINSTKSRKQLENLLEETTKQAALLNEQKVQMAKYNKELESQQKELQSASEKLEAQTEELQQSNVELEVKSLKLEEQNKNIKFQKEAIQSSKELIEIKAQEVEIASKYKSEFLANMSHELRTPLNSLLILSESLANNKQGNLTEKQIEKASVINQGGNDLLTLINEILDLSKVEAGMMEVLVESVSIKNMMALSGDLFRPIAEKKGLEFNVDIEKGLGDKMDSDSQRIGQVLKNLLSNALKFTSSGRIGIKAFAAPKETMFRRSNLDKVPVIGFAVTDTGIGIPEDKQMAIFEAFQQADGSTTRNYGGTGLGLTISRELAKLMGGEIHISSKVNEGSVFTLYLPVTFLESNESDFESSNVVQSLDQVNKLESIVTIPDDRSVISESDKTILIIEDDENFAKTLQDIVNERGCKTIISTSGIEGLKLAEKYKPKAILLDLGLPDISGAQVLDNLKATLGTRHIPIHVISAGDKSKEMIKKGAFGYSHKPATSTEINDVLSKLIDFSSDAEKPILVIEDDQIQIDAITDLLSFNGVKLHFATSGKEAIVKFPEQDWSCVILDLTLQDMTGFDLLKLLEKNKIPVPPIVIHSARELTKAEFKQLSAFTEKIIVKGADSPGRLLNEVSMFLHSVESSLSPERKKMINLVNDPNSTLNGKTVLLVDDDVRNIFSMTDLLESVGMKVISAENGAEGIEKLKENTDIDVVLMDIMMPIMNGYEAMTAIREMEEYKALPIISLTAKAMKHDRAKCISAGASDYLPKPINKETLFTLIRVWLHGK